MSKITKVSQYMNHVNLIKKITHLKMPKHNCKGSIPHKINQQTIH